MKIGPVDTEIALLIVKKEKKKKLTQAKYTCIAIPAILPSKLNYRFTVLEYAYTFTLYLLPKLCEVYRLLTFDFFELRCQMCVHQPGKPGHQKYAKSNAYEGNYLRTTAVTITPVA